MSAKHFTADGTLIEAWASLKSFRPKETPPSSGSGGRNPAVDFQGERRSNQTHASTTDPKAKLCRKGQGKEAKLCFMGQVLMENRHGLMVAPCLTSATATGTAERETAIDLVRDLPGRHRITVGADKGYDSRIFVAALRALEVVPQVAQKCHGRRSAIYGRTTRHPGQALSQRVRQRVEEIFGWLKTVGNFRKTRHRGVARVGWTFNLTAAADNLARRRHLLTPVCS